MKKKIIGLFTVLSAIILLILSFSLFVSASSSVVWYQTDPVNKTYKYDKKVSVNTVSEIEAAFENAESNKTLYIVLERDITMDSGMKKFSDWYFIGLYPNTDSSIIFDFNGHSISMSVESGDLSSKLYYGIRIDAGHAKSLTFTDTKGEGGIYFTAYVYDDGPTTALRIIGNDNCVVTFDGGIYSLDTKNGKYQQVFTNGNKSGITPTNWPFSIRDTAFTYTRAAVGLVGGKCVINDGAFRAIIKKTNENEDQRYRYLSAIGLGYRHPDANNNHAIQMTQLTINGGMFISERYSVLLTPGDIGKIYRAPVINGGYFCGRAGIGGGICLCSTFLTSYTGFSKDNYSDQFKGYKFSTVVPSSSILLVNGEKKSADSLTFKDLARMDDILVIPFSEGNNKAVDASTGKKITGTIELEVGEKFTVNNVVEDFPNWVTKTGLLISKPSIEVYSTDTGKKNLLGNTKGTFSYSEPQSGYLYVHNMIFDKKDNLVYNHTHKVGFCVNPPKDEVVSSVTAKISGAVIKSGFIESSNPLSKITYTATTDCVSSVSVCWYENNMRCDELYGNNLWGSKYLKGASKYKALITFTAKDGYVFSKDTSVRIDGSIIPVISCSADGKTLVLVTAELSTACKHEFGSWKTDDTYHWHECALCEIKEDKGVHNWDGGKASGNKTIYKCTVCGKTKTVGNDKSQIYSLTVNIGNIYAGSVIPAVSQFAFASDNKYAYIENSELIWRTGRFENYKYSKPGTDKLEAGKTYTISGYAVAQPGYYVDENTKVYIRINGKQISAETILRSSDYDFLKFSITFTPSEAPTVSVTFPDKIRPGDDLINLACCNVTINGSRANEITVAIYGGQFKKLGMPLFNVYSNGKWSATNISSYLSIIGDCTKEEKEYYTKLLTAQEGEVYSLTVLPSYACPATSSSRYTVNGAKYATSVNYNPAESLGATALYSLQYSFIDSVKIESDLFTKKVGDSASVNASAGENLYKVTSVSIVGNPSKFECGKTYTAVFKIKAQSGYTFNNPMNIPVSVGGITAKVTDYTANGQEITVKADLEFSHTRIIEITDATCTEDGHTTVKCQTCGKVISDTVVAKSHSLIKVDAVSGDCMNEGTVAYYVCEICGEKFSDAKGKTIISSIKGSKDANRHIGGDIKFDKDHHWIQCACGVEIEKQGHSFDENNVCEFCGYQKSKASDSETDPVTPDNTGNTDEPATPDNTDNPTDSVITDNPDNPTDPITPDNPDNNKPSFLWLWILLAVFALVGIVIGVILGKKKQAAEK